MESKGKAVDDVHIPRAPPRWIESDLFRQMTPSVEDRRLYFIMEKRIHRSDLDLQQNRLLLPSRFVEDNLLPILSDEERRLASLDAHDNVGRKRKYKYPVAESSQMACQCGGKRRRPMELGREHGGLDVKVVIRRQFRLDMKLTRWDASEATVLKGHHWRLITGLGDFKEGDVVEMWAFRHKIIVKEEVIDEVTQEKTEVKREVVWLCLTLSRKI